MPSDDRIPSPVPFSDQKRFTDFLTSSSYIDDNLLSKEGSLLDEFDNVLDSYLPENDAFDTKMTFDSNLFDSLMELDDTSSRWSDSFPVSSIPGVSPSIYIKSESETPSSSPRSLSSSSDSSSSSEVKFNLETPPVSPPRLESGPVLDSTTASVVHEKKSQVLKINPDSIQIIPCTGIKTLKPLKQRQIVLPKEIVEKVAKIKKDSQPPSLDTSASPLVFSCPASAPVVVNKGKKIAPNISVVSNRAKLLKMSPSPPLILPPLATTKNSDDLTLKALKKQQRMIKNRESACLSRKKKKEYVTNLESKLKDLEGENSKLRKENAVLKARLKEIETTSGLGTNRKVFNNFRKSTAVLAVLLMVSLNIGSLSTVQKEDLDSLYAGRRSVESGEVRHFGRSLLWAEPKEKDTSVNSSSKAPTCPLFVNQTESLRLEKELRRWIGVDKPVSGRNSTGRFNLFKPSSSFKLWRNIKLNRKVDSALDLYRAPFLGSLPRKSDTFYVVSFSSDHLLLPAIAHNVTARPKMSLFLPTIPFGDSATPNGTVPMMQIDCEVLATRSLQLSGEDIKQLRKSKPSSKATNSTNQALKEPAYRPYFIRSSKGNSVGTDFDQNFDSNFVNTMYKSRGTFP